MGPLILHSVGVLGMGLLKRFWARGGRGGFLVFLVFFVLFCLSSCFILRRDEWLGFQFRGLSRQDRYIRRCLRLGTHRIQWKSGKAHISVAVPLLYKYHHVSFPLNMSEFYSLKYTVYSDRQYGRFSTVEIFS